MKSIDNESLRPFLSARIECSFNRATAELRNLFPLMWTRAEEWNENEWETCLDFGGPTAISISPVDLCFDCFNYWSDNCSENCFAWRNYIFDKRETKSGHVHSLKNRHYVRIASFPFRFKCTSLWQFFIYLFFFFYLSWTMLDWTDASRAAKSRKCYKTICWQSDCLNEKCYAHDYVASTAGKVLC